VAAAERFWVNTVSLDHVQAAVLGGFTQAEHGARTRLARPQLGDWMVFYSPRTALNGGIPVRQFTAIGVVTGRQPHQAIINEDFRPWRLQMRFADSRPADAKPLVSQLSFVKNPLRWGLPFRQGLFSISPSDFQTIAAAMDVTHAGQ
jgi:hypothetical protein